MKTRLVSWTAGFLALLLSACVAWAQDRVAFRQAELDQMLAPIALYPDPLLSQVLMAATYPLEVVQAARWSRANPGLKGRDAVNAAEHMDWDPSVKSLTAFPQVLAMMDEKLEWTERLGEAFLAQPGDVMETVQALRRRAETAGHLASGEHARVTRHGEHIVIEPPATGVVYVPYYQPAVVYGAWWWPDFPPFYWAPPRYYALLPAHRPVVFWDGGIVVSGGFFFGHFNWPRREVRVVHVHHVHRDVRPVRVESVWRHDPGRRRGASLRHAVTHQRAGERAGAPAQQVVASPAGQVPSRASDLRERRAEPATSSPRPQGGNVAPRTPAYSAPTHPDSRSAATAAPTLPRSSPLTVRMPDRPAAARDHAPARERPVAERPSPPRHRAAGHESAPAPRAASGPAAPRTGAGEIARPPALPPAAREQGRGARAPAQGQPRERRAERRS
jgi:hypothetical protein